MLELFHESLNYETKRMFLGLIKSRDVCFVRLDGVV
jgi:hypothetical protein